MVRRSQGSGFASYEDNMKGEYEEGDFGFSNDFSVRFDNLDYDQVGREMPKNISLLIIR